MFRYSWMILPILLWQMTSVATGQNRVLNLNPQLRPFYHGVASGDPLTDRVIIWTRLTPDTGFVGPAAVDWRVALDTGMTQVVQAGSFTTDQNLDYTVKVDVTGLQPNTYYYYEFTHGQRHSIRGRTKTAPVGMQDSMRFAVVSCANYEAGFFNVYRVIKERNDIDALIHLGDYIYEYENDGYGYNGTAGRHWEPSNEILSLSDYRTRYSCYKLDEDLIRLHQQYPWINIWDDHESANNSWMNGAENHNGGEGPWANRKAASQQAYMEWVPIRPVQSGNNELIYRRIRFGNLCEFFMMDTRLHGREEQAGTIGSTVNDPNRTLLGSDQYTWLVSGLLSSSSQWKVMGQQVMMAPLKVAGIAINEDQWDGYPAERNKIMSFVLANNINDVAVITGDIHSSWGNDVPTANYQSNGNGSAFVEFVTPSVTSPGFPIGVGESVVMLANNHIKYADLNRHGFIILDITQQRIQSDWFYVNTLDQSSNQYVYGDSWYENHNERHLRHSVSAAPVRHDLYYLQAPAWPRPFVAPNVSAEPVDMSAVVVGVYPNPVQDGFTIQLYLEQTTDVEMEIMNAGGQLIHRQQFAQQPAGVSFLHGIMSPGDASVVYAPGVYLVRLSWNGNNSVFRVIKQ